MAKRVYTERDKRLFSIRNLFLFRGLWRKKPTQRFAQAQNHWNKSQDRSKTPQQRQHQARMALANESKGNIALAHQAVVRNGDISKMEEYLGAATEKVDQMAYGKNKDPKYLGAKNQFVKGRYQYEQSTPEEQKAYKNMREKADRGVFEKK